MRSRKAWQPKTGKTLKPTDSQITNAPENKRLIFGHSNLIAFRWKYDRQKASIAQRIQNPRLKQIKFHSLRHFKATKEYAMTRNILNVKELLGHRNINITLVYTHLVPVDDDAENYHHATAKDAKEAGELIEQA
ncbi:MAG: tyrosine-type recombinase/integrase [Candidatus Bathyarchaeia archaeon]